MRMFFVAILVLVSPIAFAQSYGGAEGTWDISIGAIYQDSLSAGGEGSDMMAETPDSSSLKIDNELGFGFSFAYNITDHLAVGLDIDWLRPDYKATLVPDDPNESETVIDHELTQWNWRLKGSYNFTDGPLVPYVDLGYAWTNIDSNVIEGEPITGCWWDPWFGYICRDFYTTFSSTESGWGGGVGLKYFLPGGGSFLRLSWNRWELEAGGSSDDFTLESFRFDYGWRF